MSKAPRFRNSSRKCCKNIVSRKSSSDRMASLKACVLAMPCDTDESVIVADVVPLIENDGVVPLIIIDGDVDGDHEVPPPFDLTDPLLNG